MTTPASEIVKRCGGNKAVADWLGLERTAVQRWQYDSPKGLNNRIPMKHWTALIQRAAEHGVEISLDELMTEEVAEIVEAAAGAAA
jgi:hypothetical protein